MDEKIEEIKKDLQKTEYFNQITSLEITKKRKEAAIEFGKLVLIELKSLNLPFAEFIIDVGNEYGDVQFLFSANLGAPPSPIEACASGGELSRLLLAIKTVMVDGNSTLVFDEIDSNVGGNTASILGQKLMGLAKKRQVICVTHFVQVAKFATNHILVSKMAKEDQTYTTAVSLSENDKRTEYERMLGN